MIRVVLMLFETVVQTLLYQPIETSFATNNFTSLTPFCTRKIALNLESPFLIQGYFQSQQMVRQMNRMFSSFVTKNMDPYALEIRENFAIQSLNLLMKNRKTNREIYYKLIFFMTLEEVTVLELDTQKKQTVFEHDPGWEINSLFEISGSENPANDGQYLIKKKKGPIYYIDYIERKSPSSMIVSKTKSVSKAKAWKIYYLRGLKI